MLMYRQKSQGSFLWLSLVLKELITCDTDEQLQHVLDETPVELRDIYERIEQGLCPESAPYGHQSHKIHLVLGGVLGTPTQRVGTR